MICVIDTNVPLTANGKATHASMECRNTCSSFIENIVSSGKIAIDDRWLIINEYRRKLSTTGQPGVGDKFLKWVLTNYRNPGRVESVKIHPVDSYNADFTEFPDDARLAGFDDDDKKFVAVSIVHPCHPEIVNAVDEGYIGYRVVLREHGVEILNLCQ